MYGVRCQHCGNIVPPLKDNQGPVFAPAPKHLAQTDPSGVADVWYEGETPCPGSGKLGRIEAIINVVDTIDCGTF
jgi:hypothetical protein